MISDIMRSKWLSASMVDLKKERMTKVDIRMRRVTIRKEKKTVERLAKVKMWSLVQNRLIVSRNRLLKRIKRTKRVKESGSSSII